MATCTGLAGQTLDSQCLQKVDRVGQGLGGVTWRIDIQDKPYILKQISYTPASIAEADRVVKLGCHANVACYHDYFRLDNFQQQPQSLGLLIEYVGGQTLAEFIQQRVAQQSSVSTEELVRLLHTGLQALAWLHSNNLAHRDVKPANIIVSASGVKLVDLGLACYDCSTTPVSTANYMAPEQLRALINGTPLVDHRPGDVWSLGLSLMELVSLAPIYTAPPRADLYCEMQRKLVISDQRPAVQVLASMLAIDPATRPTAQQLLQNPLFAKV